MPLLVSLFAPRPCVNRRAPPQQPLDPPPPFSPGPQVVVPRTYSDYTSRRVLTTEWLDGEKLSQSKAGGLWGEGSWPGAGAAPAGRRPGAGRVQAWRLLGAAQRLVAAATDAARGRAPYRACVRPRAPPALTNPALRGPALCRLCLCAPARSLAPWLSRFPQNPQTHPTPTPQADDVGTLVNVGVICYLKQLLDTGFFHAGGFVGGLRIRFAPPLNTECGRGPPPVFPAARGHIGVGPSPPPSPSTPPPTQTPTPATSSAPPTAAWPSWISDS